MNTLPTLPGRLLIAGLACIALGAVCFVAFLITSTRELIRNHRQRRAMPHQPTPRETIAAALDDWWITTDPAAQFHAPDVAAHVHGYLAEFGYTVQPAPHPTRSHAASTTALLIALTTAIATAYAAAHTQWWASGLGALASLFLTREGLRDLRRLEQQ